MSTTSNTAEARQAIAKTILAQLGGNKFCVMTGAKNFAALDSGLSFKIGRFSGVKTTHVRVTLTALDLYNVEFIRCHGCKMTVLETVEGLYSDQLQEVFKAQTGLETSLGSLGR